MDGPKFYKIILAEFIYEFFSISYFLPAVILRTYLRLPETRSYESLGEVLWETAGAGATASSLRTAIAQAHNYPSSDVVLAKYFPEKFEWMVLTDSKVASKQSSIKKQVGLLSLL